MNQDYWLHQTREKPLFPELEWSRPENRAHAGSLLIVGGNKQGFADVAEAYAAATKAGIGHIRVLLPDTLHKTVGRLFPAADFAPSTPSGSFAKNTLGELLPIALSTDGVLLAGNFSHNSETAIVLESFLAKYQGPVAITRDAIEYVTPLAQKISQRENTLLILSFSQLQKFATTLKWPTAFTSTMDMVPAVEALHRLTEQYPLSIITRHNDQLIVAEQGRVSTTPAAAGNVWRVKTAAAASVWWLQHPGKSFEALTTSLIV